VKRFDVITIFPEMFDAVADHGITRRALDEGRFELKTWDPRDSRRTATAGSTTGPTAAGRGW
jgi:tRNA (guanine-N1)-methyltransferase